MRFMRWIEIVRRNIRIELARAGMSQRQAAEFAGISQSAFSDRMQRNEGFKLAELIALAAGLNIPISMFLTDLDTADELLQVDGEAAQ